MGTVTPTLSWTAAPGASEYEVWVIDAQSDWPVLHQNTSYTWLVVPSGVLTAGQQYRWKARGFNVVGNGGYSNILYFVPLCSPPQSVPVLVPMDDCIETLTPTLSWSAVDGATSYEVAVFQVSPEVLVADEEVPGFSYTVPAGRLSLDVAYHSKVRAKNASGNGDWSASVYFTPSAACEREVSEETEIRPIDTGSGICLAPDAVGRPVSVVTGNMYLDQVDIGVPGIGPPIVFSRSYNSANVVPGRYGVFGPGWSHPYERSLSFEYGNMIRLRAPDGTSIYLEDKDGDSVFTPIIPLTEQSKVTRRPDGVFIRAFRSGGSEEFDGAGRLTALVDLVGARTTLQRDGQGRLVALTNAGGRTVTLTFTGDRLTGLSGPGALVTVTYGYDGQGRLTSVTHGDGSGYSFEYDAGGRLLVMRDAAGTIVESHTYDSQGRGITSSISEGRERYTLSYEPSSTTVTDALGNVTTYEYEEIKQIKRVKRITGPCASCGGAGGDVQVWTYDDAGRVKTHRTADNQVTHYEYDPETGDLLVAKDALLNSTIYTYYPDGRVRTVTSPDGATTVTTYVAAGPATVAETISPGVARKSSTTYNAQGRPEEVTDSRGKVTTLAYNATGDLESVTDATGRNARFGYDAMGRQVTVTDDLENATTTSYDARGRVHRVTSADGTFTEFHYDLGGRRTRVIDPLGREVRYGYDAYGRPQHVVDPQEGVTRSEYDLMSRLTALVDAEGRATAFEYDGHGRVTRTVFPGAGVEPLTYDTAGRMLKRIDRRGVETAYAYDALGRLLRRSYSDGTPEARYVYDSKGRMTRASNGTDTLTWSYDHLDRVVSETSARNGTAVSYEYDKAGNRLSMSLNGESFATYTYDDAGRLTGITRGAATFSFGYDELGRRSSMTYPNSVVTTYEYDRLSRLTRLRAVKDGANLTDFTYEYDAAGNRTRKTTLDYMEDYRYDALNRLVEASRPESNQRWLFGYDRVGNRVSYQTDNDVQRSTYDERNALVSQEGGGRLRFRGVLDEPGTVTLDGQPARMLGANMFELDLNVVAGTNAVTVQATDGSGNTRTQRYEFDVTPVTSTYAHDANGNLTAKTDSTGAWTYEWNADNQLKRVTKDGNEVAHFAYDPKGRRVEKVAGGVTTSWTYDASDILREAADGTSVRYVHGAGVDEPLAREDTSGNLSQYHADGLGSIAKTSDSIGAATLTRQYDAWGNLQNGATIAGYAFTGREWDPETGLYYYRARYYDPAAARFIAEDPIGFAGGDTNLYGYVAANPQNLRDPEGLLIDPRALDWLNQWMRSKADDWKAQNAAGGWPWAAQKFWDWTRGGGPDHDYYGPGSSQAADMMDAYGVQRARSLYCKITTRRARHGQPPRAVTNIVGPFPFPAGPIRAGTNPVQQFVGSFRVDIYPNQTGTRQVVVTNTTSFTSFWYGIPPSWDRSTFPFFGNMRQTFFWNEPCTCP